MSVSQSRLLICLLASSLLSTTSLADSIIVNTTVDENNINNQSCSLREAVSYLNAKNIKKAQIDEEVAIIAGNSSTALTQAKFDLAVELAKTSPDAVKVAQLQSTIDQLTLNANTNLLGLNRQLKETTESISTEKEKTNPDTALIASYEAKVTQLQKDIKIKEEEKTAKNKELQDYRDKGLWGCISKDSTASDSLTLENKLYLLDTPLTINLALTISADTSAQSQDSIIQTANDTVQTLEDNNQTSLLRPIIKANSNNSLFVIDNGIDNTATAASITSPKIISVSFNSIDFVGCEQQCATNGGIIVNKEILAITNSVITKGQVSNRGGAIYNAANASLSISKSVFRNNQAFDGAAIFSEENNISIENALITQNQTTNTNGGIVTIASDAITLSSTIPHIENSTLSENKGAAVSLFGNMILNNNTIIENTVGVRLNNKLPLIYNSIIAGNTQADCDSFLPIPNDGKVYFANNLSVINKGCPTSLAKHNNKFITNIGNETLLAAKDNNNRCAAPPANGLLCPLNENGGLTKTYKPRLLVSYAKLSDSPIVNKGFDNVIANQGLLCSTTDQRGLPRENGENRCDIGAVEIQAGLFSYTQGDDIVFGQLKRFSPIPNLTDAELLPADSCSSILGAGEYLNGCIRLIDLPKYGVAHFDPQNSDILYSTTNPEFHGFDKFSYSVITTLSRFSDAANDKFLKTNVRIVSEPSESLASKSLDNGATGIFSLLMLSSLLAIWRRTR